MRISHIERKIEPNQGIIDSVRQVSMRIIDSLDLGVAWDILAQRYSQDSMAGKGGDLGFYRKGLLEPEYERAAWRLRLGQYTDSPVKTRLGWHIIRILGKKDDEIRSAQILLRTIGSASDSARIMVLMDSIAELGRKEPGRFTELAKTFSQDGETNWKGGSLGWLERSEVDSAYQQVITNLSAGEISSKVLIDGSWHIFRLDEELPSRSLTLDEDYLKIESFTMEQMANERLQKLVQKWRKEMFIEIRLDRKS